MSTKDGFDDFVEGVVRDEHSPKPKPVQPPPGSAPVVNYRSTEGPLRKFRSSPDLTPSGTAEFFYWLSIGGLIVSLLIALLVGTTVGLWNAAGVLFAGVVSAMLWMALSKIVAHLHETAHWTQQTAEAMARLEEKR